ncbi:MAG: Corrinoid/iron-sulfur protein small subunit AcsD [Thermoanaerobacterales bacterium 50_218]|nr:MAG: Corrinoid/iron-sulfur protein small subunit AcsD [Thermoanaerobacterales bacterium 50_218]HAA90310.1 acetyl-CoA decarbonylase/synthase complex subunit delta [Peptococcaceae bacterium]
MPVEIFKEKYTGKVQEVVLGATKEEGGTRAYTVKLGGSSALPFLQFEGESARPVIAMEVWDIKPNWHECFEPYIGDVWEDPVAWAQKLEQEYGAEVIYLTLKGADPERENPKSADDCAKLVKKILENTKAPLMVEGCGNYEKDNEVLQAVAEAAAGENIALGMAEKDNYRSIAAACMMGKHCIIARSPVDINIMKQLNIMILDMGVPADKIINDPLASGLGYGIEYSYSIMERARYGALVGDKMMAFPIVCLAGQEAWRAKEAVAPDDAGPGWGDQKTRGIMWEAMTAAALIQGGADIVLLRHPEAAKLIKEHIEDLMVPNTY